jgi:hypothetical protein
MMIKRSQLRKYAVPVGVFVIYGCLFAAVHHWGTEKVPFSKAGWESKADLGDRWPIAQSLIETGCLRGKTEPEVLQMLGQEDAREVDEKSEPPGDVTLTYVAPGRLRFGIQQISIKSGSVVRAEFTSMY